MDVVTTSLEALIQRAINPQNQKLDSAAMDAFCVMVVRETGGMQIGCKLLATHIQSSTESEALQALTLLDTCMKRCGRSFHAEVGKFRFLNEMIKLVSPKYLGNRTPAAVRQRVLELLQAWTQDYPREAKIKEAFEMLKKQGVVKDSPPAHQNQKPQSKSQSPKVRNALFEDEETAKLLQELLQSKDPFELQLANKLIKSMVKDDERRIQQKSQRHLELESVHNNVKLLSEMLDSYNPTETNPEDVELMKELHQTCERLKPTLLRLAEETQDNDDTLSEVLTANDELSQVFEKFSSTFGPSEESNANGTSLLDLDCPLDANSSAGACLLLNDNQQNSGPSDIEMLGDIFNSIGTSLPPTSPPDVNNFDSLMSNVNVLQPVAVISPLPKPEEDKPAGGKVDGKAKALEDLNEMGKIMLQESLLHNKRKVKSLVDDFGGNLTVSGPAGGSENDSNKNQELLIDETKTVSAVSKTGSGVGTANANWGGKGGDSNENKCPGVERVDAAGRSATGGDAREVDIKPLNDLHVSLSDIKPSQVPPVTVIDNKNGISVILHCAEGAPREDVTVIVVTTVSKNCKALTNYLFQAVVPNTCKCRLQQPSGVSLPGHNPFLPPAAITQIMLIANPTKVPLSLKFMLSYTMEDETFTEMGEVDSVSTQ